MRKRTHGAITIQNQLHFGLEMSTVVYFIVRYRPND